MRIALRFIEGGLAGQTVEAELLAKKHAAVGRDPAAAFALPETDRSASTMHAKFVLEGKDVVLNDIGSQYGTYVNDRPMPRARLKGGEMLRFGVKGPLAEFVIIAGGTGTSAAMPAGGTALPPPPPPPKPPPRARGPPRRRS
jgi:hypothetical protein